MVEPGRIPVIMAHRLTEEDMADCSQDKQDVDDKMAPTREDTSGEPAKVSSEDAKQRKKSPEPDEPMMEEDGTDDEKKKSKIK